MIEKIVSGGQTGVDRAALDIALERGIACGGWCPAGRHADDGVIPERYPLQETAEMDHTIRTEHNVRDSDGTLMLYRGALQGGTAYAVLMARHLGRPVLAFNLDETFDVDAALSWMRGNRIRVLHVGGQRESSCPGIYQAAKRCLETLLNRLEEGG
ncbi:MAG: putative molybdenum carrier protein [Gammaproteobacteria bacterium]|nr:putative molybdenum carrier protein [Gammaproteobacteria bacterium]